MSQLTVAQLAEACGGRTEGDIRRTISGASALGDASETDLSYVANAKGRKLALHSHAGCLVVPVSFEGSGPWSLIRVDNPRNAFVRAVEALFPKKSASPGIHATATIALTASVATDCFVGAYTSIGEQTRIGDGCSIGNHCAIGEDVTIGRNTVLHPHVTVYDGVRIGSRAVLHSGCVLGADGFGFTLTDDHYEKFPQIGSVDIGDDVEIGANCCIDRAALGTTRIGDGTKIDNLVHVAHNCNIGKHVVIAAQAGFSGGVWVGDYAAIGGQAGFGENAKVDEKAVVGGKSGVLPSHRVRSGEPVWGIPARPLRTHLIGLANIGKISELRERVQELERKIKSLDDGRTSGS